MKSDNLALMVTHENYDLLMSKGKEIIEAIKAELDSPSRKRTNPRGTPSTYRLDFSCFSVRLCLRVEFDIPLQQYAEPIAVLGSLVLYQTAHEGGDEVLTPFPFIGEEDKKTNTLTYNGAGFVRGYKVGLSKEMEQYYKDPSTRERSYYANLRDFPPYLLDTLESFIARSGLRVIPE